MANRWGPTAAFALAALCAVGVSMRLADFAAARPWIDMGIKDDAAFSQPIVRFELFQQLGNGDKGTSLGPEGDGFLFFPNEFILDTGASSIIAMNDAEASLSGNGYVTVNQVEEQGVAGTEFLDVSDSYFVEVTESNGIVQPLPNTRIMSGQFPILFGVNGVVGMPAMVGKVLTLDVTHWTTIGEIEDLDDLLDALLLLSSIDVRIGNSLPASNGHRYSVPIRAKSFPLTGPGELPTASPLPMLEMSVGFGNQDATGDFVLDTGAAISFISTEMAIAIGLDSNHDGVLDEDDDQFFDRIDIGGIGGVFPAPEFFIDRYTVLTEQGVELVWNSEQALSVLVVDIHPDIDGVLGSDVLTSGWIRFLEEELDIEIGEGPLLKSHFDFRDFDDDGDFGTAYFDLTASFDVVQPGPVAGDYNRDGVVDAGDYVAWRNTLGSEILLNADGNGNKIVDAEDYLIWKDNFGQTGPVGPGGGGFAVPEPGGALLMMAGIWLAGLLRRAALFRPFGPQR